jgi:tetratricopeptide (TPR) repeat protein
MHMAHAKVTGNLVFIDLDRGDLKSARLRTEENLLQNRALRNGRGVVVGLANLAMICHQQGDLTRAKSLYEEALQGSRRIPLPNTEAVALRGMSKLAHNEGHVEDACEGYEESVARFRDLGNVDGELRALIGLADAHLQTRPDVAATHLDRAADLIEYAPSAAAHIWLRLGVLAARAGDASSARDHLRRASDSRSEQLAWQRCSLEILRAETLHHIGDTTAAAALIDEIRATVQGMSLEPTSELVCELTRVGNMTDPHSP